MLHQLVCCHCRLDVAGDPVEQSNGAFILQHTPLREAAQEAILDLALLCASALDVYALDTARHRTGASLLTVVNYHRLANL